MGHNPHLDTEMKPTVHLCIAVALYHTERITKSVYSISKPARELLTKGVRVPRHPPFIASDTVGNVGSRVPLDYHYLPIKFPLIFWTPPRPFAFANLRMPSFFFICSNPHRVLSSRSSLTASSPSG